MTSSVIHAEFRDVPFVRSWLTSFRGTESRADVRHLASKNHVFYHVCKVVVSENVRTISLCSVSTTKLNRRFQNNVQLLSYARV